MTYYPERRKEPSCYRFSGRTLRMLDELVVAMKARVGNNPTGQRITKTSVLEFLVHAEHQREFAEKTEVEEKLAESGLTVADALRVIAQMDEERRKGAGSRRQKTIVACKTEDTSQICADCGKSTSKEGAACSWTTLTGEVQFRCHACDRK